MWLCHPVQFHCKESEMRFKISKFNCFLSAIVVSAFGLQACGTFENNDPSSSLSGEEISKNSLSMDSVDGTWIRKCSADVGTEVALTLKNGRFTTATSQFTDGCKILKERFITGGTFVTGGAASNPRELQYGKSNFTLIPSSLNGIRNIDFTIDEWTFELNEQDVGKDRSELKFITEKCPAAKVEDSGKVIRVLRNGCELSDQQLRSAAAM